jgi:hypothetical protein
MQPTLSHCDETVGASASGFSLLDALSDTGSKRTRTNFLHVTLTFKFEVIHVVVVLNQGQATCIAAL